MAAQKSAIAITTDDNNDLAQKITALYVGQAGDLSLILRNDTTPVLLKAVPIGTVLNLSIKRIRSTGTTAAQLIGFF